jgi:hypothetical protein
VKLVASILPSLAMPTGREERLGSITLEEWRWIAEGTYMLPIRAIT